MEANLNRAWDAQTTGLMGPGEATHRRNAGSLWPDASPSARLIAAMADHIIVVDRMGYCLETSGGNGDAHASGWWPVGCGIGDGLDGAAAETLIAKIGTTLDRGGTLHYAFDVPGPSGHRFFEMDGIPLDADRLLCAVRDITRLKKREIDLLTACEAAERANRGKSENINTLNHELRTPLNAVLGFADMIDREIHGPVGSPKYREYAGDIGATARHMLDLVNRLLDLARIEAGRTPFAEEPCSAATLVDEVLAMVRGQAAKAGVSITRDIDPELPDFLGDPTMIRQMLINLIVNAIKFSNPKGGHILIGAALADEGLAITVADNGIGMNEGEIPLALSPFDQLANGRSRGERGFGLGLPLTKALIEQHGGRLHLSSMPGEGTLVRLIFPGTRLL